MFKRSIIWGVLLAFIPTLIIPYRSSWAADPVLLGLPLPGTMVNLSRAYQPVIIRGLTVHKDNPFLFDFIVDVGQDKLSGGPLKKEGEKLIKYFLASLAIPDRDVWVNLSPYERKRMIPDMLGATDMGRDLLAQDYILKQLTASLIYPEKDLGRKFWDKVYERAYREYGTKDVPVNTFNKVWIMADRAEVFERNQTVFIVDTHLKVMLEEDYLALQKHNKNKTGDDVNNVHSAGSQIVREIILPEIEKEVNQGKNFANLRQIFNSIILANWYKNSLKQALLNHVYANKAKIKGIDSDDPTLKEQIYQQYLQAYKKGVFNYIKEDISSGQVIPRKYFSGGVTVKGTAAEYPTEDNAMVATSKLSKNVNGALVLLTTGLIFNQPNADGAMTAKRKLKQLVAQGTKNVEAVFAKEQIKGTLLKANGKLGLVVPSNGSFAGQAVWVNGKRIQPSKAENGDSEAGFIVGQVLSRRDVISLGKPVMRGSTTILDVGSNLKRRLLIIKQRFEKGWVLEIVLFNADNYRSPIGIGQYKAKRQLFLGHKGSVVSQLARTFITQELYFLNKGDLNEADFLDAIVREVQKGLNPGRQMNGFPQSQRNNQGEGLPERSGRDMAMNHSFKLKEEIGAKESYILDETRKSPSYTEDMLDIPTGTNINPVGPVIHTVKQLRVAVNNVLRKIYKQETGEQLQLGDIGKPSENNVIIEIGGSPLYLQDPQGNILWSDVRDLDVYFYIPEDLRHYFFNKGQEIRQDTQKVFVKEIKRRFPRFVHFRIYGMDKDQKFPSYRPYHPFRYYFGDPQFIDRLRNNSQQDRRYKELILETYSRLYDEAVGYIEQSQDGPNRPTYLLQAARLFARLAKLRGDKQHLDSLVSLIDGVMNARRGITGEDLLISYFRARPLFDRAMKTTADQIMTVDPIHGSIDHSFESAYNKFIKKFPYLKGLPLYNPRLWNDPEFIKGVPANYSGFNNKFKTFAQKTNEELAGSIRTLFKKLPEKFERMDYFGSNFNPDDYDTGMELLSAFVDSISEDTYQYMEAIKRLYDDGFAGHGLSREDTEEYLALLKTVIDRWIEGEESIILAQAQGSQNSLQSPKIIMASKKTPRNDALFMPLPVRNRALYLKTEKSRKQELAAYHSVKTLIQDEGAEQLADQVCSLLKTHMPDLTLSEKVPQHSNDQLTIVFSGKRTILLKINFIKRTIEVTAQGWDDNKTVEQIVRNGLGLETGVSIKGRNVDSAMKVQLSTAPGGINLNTSDGMLWKDRKEGGGVLMDLDPAMMARFEKDGIDYLSPKVLKMTPIKSVWLLMGLNAPLG